MAKIKKKLIKQWKNAQSNNISNNMINNNTNLTNNIIIKNHLTFTHSVCYNAIKRK